MKIGIEAERANLKAKTGVEHYAKELILHLAKIDLENEYFLYLRTKPEEWFTKLPKNFHINVIPFPVFWTQLRISWEMFKSPVDVLFIPASALPFFHPKNSVVTIHDIAWKYFPESFTWFNRVFLEYSTKYALKKASKIIAVSESTKKDILKFYKTNPLKVSVVHHGYDSNITNFENQHNFKNLNLPEKYILFLSTLQPRKNLEGAIKAFNLLKIQYPEIEHKFVVVGKLGWKFESILKLIKENSEFVIYLNHLTQKEKNIVLKNASALILPSFYEGFGMTILEAFSANIPVLTSNVSSMPEVAGDAGIYFDPKNVKDMANAIKIVLFDKALAQNLVFKGRERLKQFSWEKSAEKTLQILTKAI